MTRPAWTSVGIVSVALVALFALAASTAFGQDASTESGPTHTITVSSSATISTTPDEALITFGIHTDDTDSVVALNENAETMDDVLAAMKALGVLERDMETTNVSVSPQTINRGTASEATIFNSSTTLSVTIRDFDRIGRAIRDGVRAGATRVQGVRFQVSDGAGAKKRALASAVESARAKADALAKAAGTSVTGAVRIQERGSAGRTTPSYLYDGFAQNFSRGAAGDLAIVPPRDIETKVSITVIWSIG